jgi:peroxiredoxin
MVWAQLADDASGWAFLISLGSLALAASLVLLHRMRRVPLGALRVRVGDRLLPFEAQTPEGERFASDALAGRRVLLKFFRGEWCPFCQAELKQFDAMREDLSAHGVEEVIALSKDTPEAAQRHRARDGLNMQLLCDPELRVIRQYGVEHKKALEISAGPRIALFGLAVGTRPAFRHMAAPTTLLVDEHGVIRWIDQTDDYKVRSSSERVLGAVEAAFGASARKRTPASVHSAVVRADEPSCAPC